MLPQHYFIILFGFQMVSKLLICLVLVILMVGLLLAAALTA